MFKPFRIDARAFYESIIMPAFADLTPGGFPNDAAFNEWTLMDGVSSSRPIVEIRGTQNILQRRDASCDINYKKVVGTSNRTISTTELYAATQMCRNEFYQGCLKDWRSKDPLFGNLILPYFKAAINSDLAANAYFGDTNRVSAVNATWSVNAFNGIFYWYKRYITEGVIPSGQTIAITDNTDYSATPAAAYALISGMYAKQSLLMYSWADNKKAFYVSKEIARGYEEYLISVGLQAAGYTLITNGINRLAYKGIPIIEMPTWTPIISEIKGSAGYAAILTLRGNFVFATDSTYGEGENGRTALEVWYEEKDMTWYYRYFVKAGTQIALPEHSVIAMTSFT